MLGGWEFQPYLTAYDSYIFYNAIGMEPSFIYSPIAVATQIVNGTNYRFISIARPKNPEESSFFAVISIFKPIDGRPYVTDISPIQ